MPTSLDFSAASFFFQASTVVQGVLALLVLASIICWAIIVEKTVILVGMRRQLRLFERLAQEEKAAAARAPGRPDSLARIVLGEGQSEWAIEKTGESITNRRDRAERAMREMMVAQLIRAEARLQYLATIASSAPFVGLFGTVWGIMHAFTSIAQSGDTGLATVAPGIAEALSTTAFGLVAAIPASIAYNKLASDFATLARRLNLAIARVARRLDQRDWRAAAE